MFVVFYSVTLYVLMNCSHPTFFMTHLSIHGMYVCMKSKVNFHSFKHSKGV